MTATMTDERIGVQPLPGGLGARVTGVDLSKDLAAGLGAKLQAAIDTHALLVLPAQDIDRGRLVAFSRLFGPLLRHYVTEYLVGDHPEIMVLSNNYENGKRLGAPNNGIYWHSDQIFRKRPVSLTLLYGHEVPAQGGDTLFADMRAIYNALPEPTQMRIAGRRAIHSFQTSYDKNYIEAEPLTAERRRANPDVDHPVVRVHPHNGVKSLFLDPDSTTRILDLPDAESAAILSQAFAYLDQPRYLYSHAWQPRDLVVWDNRCLLHKATGYNESAHRRVMWRTQVEGEEPV